MLPPSTLKSWGSSSRLVRLSQLPTLVTRGSFLIACRIFAPSSSVLMDLNLRMRAQVNGLRGETPSVELMEKRVEADLWYVNNWSFWLDLRILWRTVL
jgi:hypothetical protein